MTTEDKTHAVLRLAYRTRLEVRRPIATARGRLLLTRYGAQLLVSTTATTTKAWTCTQLSSEGCLFP